MRVYEWSNPDAAEIPVVLLPGRGSGVPMWSENLPHLAVHRTVYAMDAVGDAGLSVQSTPLIEMAEQAQWIDEAMAELGLDRAHIVGHSFGAASAAALAVHRPARVQSLTLLEPAFVLGWPPLATLLWAVPASLPMIPESWRHVAVAKIAGEDLSHPDPNDPVTRMITLGAAGYAAELPTPWPLSDQQLGGLPMPVYVALADGSPITEGSRSLARAELIRYVTAKVWPHTTHSLPMQVAEPLAEELAAFWASHDD